MYVCGTNTAVLRIKLASLPSADKKKKHPKKQNKRTPNKTPQKKKPKKLKHLSLYCSSVFLKPKPIFEMRCKINTSLCLFAVHFV